MAPRKRDRLILAIYLLVVGTISAYIVINGRPGWITHHEPFKVALTKHGQ